MRDFIFVWLSIVTVSVASVSGSSSYDAPQKEFSTSAKIPEHSCANFWVAAEPDKPFIAERKTITVQGDEVQFRQEGDFVARDAVGRIHEESHGPNGDAVPFEQFALGGLPSSRRDLNVRDASRQFIVTILDCVAGARIFLFPDRQYATMEHFQGERQKFLHSDTVIRATTHPDAIVEDLGYGLVEGIQARGTKITSLGHDKDGDWNGKPVRVFELWVSDELGVTLTWNSSDLIKGTTNYAFLKGIRRGEPDPCCLRCLLVTKSTT
jgi:hypothetical protein